MSVEDRLNGVIKSLSQRIVVLRAGINRAGGLASQGASHETIRQVLAEAKHADDLCPVCGSDEDTQHDAEKWRRHVEVRRKYQRQYMRAKRKK